MGSLDLGALNNLYDETQYFWFESSAQPWGAGAHVTLYPQSEFTTSTHANYLKGQNILINTDGISIRNGLLPMMTLDNDSLDFNTIDTTNGTYTNVASFGAVTRIGEIDNNRVEIDTTKIQFQSPENLMFRVRNNGTVYHEDMQTFLYDENEDAIFAWNENVVGIRTALMWTFLPRVSINNILLKIHTIGGDSLTINTGTNNPYTENGYTISYSVDGSDNITLNVTKNTASAEGRTIVNTVVIAYNTTFNTSTTSCGSYWESEDDNQLTDTYVFQVGVGRDEYNRENAFYIGYNNRAGFNTDLDVTGDLNIYGGDIYVGDYALNTDYIIETGSSGIWTWNKYSSGKIECWGEKSWSNVACTTSAGGGYRSGDQSQALPSGLFSTIQSCQATMKGSGGSGYAMTLRTLCTTTLISQMFWNTTNATKSTCTVDYYIIGT